MGLCANTYDWLSLETRASAIAQQIAERVYIQITIYILISIELLSAKIYIDHCFMSVFMVFVCMPMFTINVEKCLESRMFLIKYIIT